MKYVSNVTFFHVPLLLPSQSLSTLLMSMIPISHTISWGLRFKEYQEKKPQQQPKRPLILGGTASLLHRSGASCPSFFHIPLVAPAATLGHHRAPLSGVSPAIHLTGYLCFLTVGVINCRKTDFPLLKSLTWWQSCPSPWEPLLGEGPFQSQFLGAEVGQAQRWLTFP